MARPAVRIQVVEFGVLVGLVLLVGRAVQVQILHGRRWAEEAQAQRTERIVLQARRGTLYDRHGTPLAVTQETYHVGIAPNELRDPTADGARISRRLGLTARAGPRGRGGRAEGPSGTRIRVAGAGDRPTGAGARRGAHARRGAAGDRTAGAGRRPATYGRGRRGRGDARSGDGRSTGPRLAPAGW